MKQEREVQGPRGVNQKESPGQRDGEGGGGSSKQGVARYRRNEI